MSEISFIPCELCDELISFNDYTNHTNECQRSYSGGSINRRYGNDYVFISSQLRRSNINAPLQPQQSLPDTQQQSLPDTPQLNINTLLNNENNENNEHNENNYNNYNIRTLENYLSRMIRSYNEEERIFNEEVNRINRIYRINLGTENNHISDVNELDYINNDETNDDMPSLIDGNEEDNDETDDDMPSLIDGNEEDNEVGQLESSTNIPETEQNTASNLIQNNMFLNSSNILPNPPQSLSPSLHYPNRRIQRLNRYRHYLRTTNLPSLNNIGNSYEELTRLGERLGNVSVGIKKMDNICRDYIVDEDEDCFVCREEFKKGDKMKKLLCGHYFCEDCISTWFKDNKKCPVCMVEYNDDGLIKPKITQIECEVSTYV